MKTGGILSRLDRPTSRTTTGLAADGDRVARAISRDPVGHRHRHYWSR